MVYIRAFCICILFFGAKVCVAQQIDIINIGGPKYLVKTNDLPGDITSSRSVVVVEVPTETKDGYKVRGDWKKFATVVHKNLRKIGIDAITYIYYDDLNAGPEIKAAYIDILASREVKNLLFVRKKGALPNETYSMTVAPLGESGKVLHGQSAWMEESPELDRLFLRLGRQVLRQDLERNNFLIPEIPEYLDDLAVFTGTRLENFPSRLRSLPVAVVTFEKISVENIQNQEATQQIEAYNAQVEKMNRELDSILEQLYPFKYELVNTSDNDALYQKGYQYALMPVITSGRSIKKVLNYKTSQSETDYMATVYGESGQQKLVRIPVSANVCKYYIKQTIVRDIHTGDYWDPGVSWQEGLKNFILHLRSAFNLPLVE